MANASGQHRNRPSCSHARRIVSIHPCTPGKPLAGTHKLCRETIALQSGGSEPTKLLCASETLCGQPAEHNQSCSGCRNMAASLAQGALASALSTQCRRCAGTRLLGRTRARRTAWTSLAAASRSSDCRPGSCLPGTNARVAGREETQPHLRAERASGRTGHGAWASGRPCCLSGGCLHVERLGQLRPFSGQRPKQLVPAQRNPAGSQPRDMFMLLRKLCM